MEGELLIEGKRPVPPGTRPAAAARGVQVGPQTVEEERPVEALIEENRRRGVRPDGWTAAAQWKREVDVPDPVYFRALEAMDDAAR